MLDKPVHYRCHDKSIFFLFHFKASFLVTQLLSKNNTYRLTITHHIDTLNYFPVFLSLTVVVIVKPNKTFWTFFFPCFTLCQDLHAVICNRLGCFTYCLRTGKDICYGIQMWYTRAQCYGLLTIITSTWHLLYLDTSSSAKLLETFRDI